VHANAALLLHSMLLLLLRTLPTAVHFGPIIFLEVYPIKHQFCFPHLAHIFNVFTI
jgi:hypothetical protein